MCFTALKLTPAFLIPCFETRRMPDPFVRELGGCRRIVEDEVTSRLLDYGDRMRVGEKKGSFVNRRINFEVVELTSREATNKVSESKRRLALSFTEKERVDVAIATNMISVGLTSSDWA
jgi:hypothetical protein